MSKNKFTNSLKNGFEESKEKNKNARLFETHLKKFDKEFKELKIKLRKGGFNV